MSEKRKKGDQTMKNGTTVICTNIFKGKTEEEIKKRFNICIAKIIQRESLAYSEIGQITQIDNTVKR
jgi:protein-arginine kinase